MIPLDMMLVFLAVAMLLALSPGPDNIFVLTQSALYGAKAGIFVTFGLASGLVVHTAAVALGVTALFKASPLAFRGLQIIGALYLLYLAWLAIRASATLLANTKSKPLTIIALYRRGIIMNLTNPKVGIFFIAFLPQFSSPAYGAIAPQMLVLGSLFILSSLIVFSGIAVLAGTLGGFLQRSPHAVIILNRMAGIIFVCLALRLAIQV